MTTSGYRIIPIDLEGDPRFEWAIVDPTGKIKARSWCKATLTKKVAELNEAFEFGKEFSKWQSLKLTASTRS